MVIGYRIRAEVLRALLCSCGDSGRRSVRYLHARRAGLCDNRQVKSRPLTQELTDGVVVLRRPSEGDSIAIIKGRDDEFHRFIGEGSSDPQPTAVVLDANREVVGWMDYDTNRAWLTDGEVNIGYNVFPEHRGIGVAGRSLQLMVAFLAQHDEITTATLLIDPANAPSIAVARRAAFERHEDLDGQLFFKRTLSETDKSPSSE